LANVFSTTKGLSALCIQHLVDRALLDLDAPVADYWPEFAAAGKGDIRLCELLSHRAGLAAVVERLPAGALYDHDRIARTLASQAPVWELGTQHGYHAQTFGFLLAELVRRVTGRTLGQYLRDEIAGPIAADVHIGLAAEHDRRVAKLTRPLEVLTPRGETDLMYVWKHEPDSLTARAFTNPPATPGATQTRAYRAAEIPASNGHVTALGLSRVYSAVVAGTSVLSRQGAARCSEEYVFGPDLVLRMTTRFGPGFMLSQPQGSGYFSPNLRSFGHPGMGGSLGFADPDARIGFGYVMNRIGGAILVDERPRRLIDALYACI
jgi:CubicO group peptidase (beta-lactamase class C family)